MNSVGQAIALRSLLRQNLVAVLLFAILILLPGMTLAAEADLRSFLTEHEVEKLVPGAASISVVDVPSPAAEIRNDLGDLIGHVFLNTDYLPSIGYSGKPIYVLIGMDTEGKIVGAELVKHSEPIVLVGIPVSRIAEFIDGYIGMNVVTSIAASDVSLPVNIVSGATVTVIVIDDSIKRASLRFARQFGVGGLEASAVNITNREMDGRQTDPVSWATLVEDESVSRLPLTIGAINQAFQESGNKEAAARPIGGAESDSFLDLHTALVSQPAIGRSLLGDQEYENLKARLKDGQQAILIMANGRYSFRGSGFVRGGIFDRLQVSQGEESWRFRDKMYKRIGDVLAEGAPDFAEIGLFYLPDDNVFDPVQPWGLQVLVQRSIGALERAFVTVGLTYELPEQYVLAPVPAILEEAAEDTVTQEVSATPETVVLKLWQRIWEQRLFDIAIVSLAAIVLTVIFFGQRWITARRGLLEKIRIGFLLFTCLFLGFYANAQISVVNIFTYANSLLTGFSWDYFMMDPLLFIIWSGVVVAAVLWGRGAFCGWLCPFGALQELLNKLAKLLRIPQWQVPWAIHELLWPIKYVIFIALFGLSLYSLPLAEQFAEIEPFKTVIILKFAREWPWVVYALTLLTIGLFVERFFCRYLCPLGAALALPAKLKINDWLKRYKECGNPCTRCANECMVQAIHPEGHINQNECLYCLGCQELYRCDERCPVVIQQRLRKERRLKTQSPAMTPEFGNS